MEQDGLLIGEVTARSGVSRKALRLYEATGILPAPRRTAAHYRVYGRDVLPFLAFVRQAQRLGFRLGEIRELVAIKRSGRVPCPHVRELVRRKLADLDTALADLSQVRQGLRRLLRSWRSQRLRGAVICPHIERSNRPTKGGKRNGTRQDVSVPGLRRMSRG